MHPEVLQQAPCIGHLAPGIVATVIRARALCIAMHAVACLHIMPTAVAYTYLLLTELRVIVVFRMCQSCTHAYLL